MWKTNHFLTPKKIIKRKRTKPVLYQTHWTQFRHNTNRQTNTTITIPGNPEPDPLRASQRWNPRLTPQTEPETSRWASPWFELVSMAERRLWSSNSGDDTRYSGTRQTIKHMPLIPPLTSTPRQLFPIRVSRARWGREQWFHGDTTLTLYTLRLDCVLQLFRNYIYDWKCSFWLLFEYVTIKQYMIVFL